MILFSLTGEMLIHESLDLQTKGKVGARVGMYCLLIVRYSGDAHTHTRGQPRGAGTSRPACDRRERDSVSKGTLSIRIYRCIVLGVFTRDA